MNDQPEQNQASEPAPIPEPSVTEIPGLGFSVGMPLSPEVLAMFARLAVQRQQRTVEGLVEQAHRQSDHVGVTRRAEPCCVGPLGERRDAILVTVPNQQRLDAARAQGNTRHNRTIILVAIDDHTSEAVALAMDLESMEQHVNRCCEAIAFLRRRIEAQGS